MRGLPAELAELQARVRRVASAYGLDFFETVFEMVDWDEMNTIASYEGFPVRYPHWRWGMHYDQIAKSYKWGLSKIYELVINNDPCYAYLLRGNSLVDQKLVMAHVYAHCDFFKNNLWFAPTNRRMVDELASHASRIQRHIEREGYDKVEAYLDSCLSLENLIDVYAPYAPARTKVREDDEKEEKRVVRFQAKPYMDSFINPPEFIEEQRRELEEQRSRPPGFPDRPERDVLWFLVEHAPMRSWQRDLLAMVREEAYYFAPQRLTKIMNEGWACLVGDARIFTDGGLVPARELVEERLAVKVSDGETGRAVVDWAKFEQRDTVRIRTKRGFVVEGSATHRVLLPDGEFKALSDVAVGDHVALDHGAGLWPRTKQRVPREAAAATAAAGSGSVKTAVPTVVDEDVAAALGAHVLGKTKRGTAALCEALGSAVGTVPEVILRSPKTVVAAFLKACFEHGTVGEHGVTLETPASRLLQVLLTNFGILTTRKDDALTVAGRSAARFVDQIGHDALEKAVDGVWFEEEAYDDEIVSVETGQADVFDMTVEVTHRYAAEGLIHHNSYWHSRMMTEKLLDADELVDFAERHAGAMVMQAAQVNPYKLGIELFRDIEDRWDKGRFGKEYWECDDLEVKRAWDTGLGQGREKIFEVRRIYNDVTFVDEFLTPDFCERAKLFTYDFNPKTGKREISGRDFGEIKERLLRGLANGGQPIIEVLDGNFRNRGELVLQHRHDGSDLRVDWAYETLKHLHHIWTRPVHILTKYENEPKRMSYDGESHEITDA